MGFIRQENIWKCDNCGKTGPWSDGWYSKIILHKTGGPGPYDEILVACCKECKNQLDEKLNGAK